VIDDFFDEAPKKKRKKRRGKYRPAKVYPYNDLKEIIEGIPDSLDQFLVAVTYATGGRVSEATSLSFNNFEMDGDILRITIPVKKKRRRVRDKDGNLPVKREEYSVLRAPPTSVLQEKWLVDIIWGWVKRQRLSPLDDRKAWLPTIRTAQRRFVDIMDDKPHNMRHNRATHLRKHFDYDMKDLQDFFQLSDKGMLNWMRTYSHVGRSRLDDKMRKAYQIKATPISKIEQKKEKGEKKEPIDDFF